MHATPERVREVIRQYASAWNDNDRDLFLSLFAADAEWSDPVGGPTFAGHDQIAGFWDSAHSDQGPEQELRIDVQEVIACANEGILRFIIEIRIFAENKGLDMRVTDHFVLDESGLISSLKAFWDEGCIECPEGMDLFIPSTG